MRTKPYDAYRPTGNEWLMRVPKHWEHLPLRRIGKFLKGSGGSKDDAQPTGLPCIRYGDLYTAHRTFVREAASYISPAMASQYTPLQAGDALFAASGETIDEIGKSAVNLLEGSAYCGGDVIVLRPQRPMVSSYLGYTLNCRPVVAQKSLGGRGITVVHIYPRHLKSVVLPLPPMDEQNAIARFLDHATRRIDCYIRAKEKLIALLEEQKRATINEAVTGQIDVRTGRPYPIYKDSGVEWLEAVPGHWDVRPAKWHLREVDERSVTGTEEMLSVSHLTGVTPRSEKNVTMFEAESNVGHKLCEPGDVVVNTMWAWMGALGIAQQPGLVSPSYAVYRPMKDSSLQRRYAEMMLRSEPLRGEFIRRSTGIRPSRLRLYPDSFLRVRLIAPPPEEQSAIIDFVARETARSDRVCRLMTEEVSALQEYRVRLVADVVTGKLDVRQAAELDEQCVTCGVDVDRASADSNSSVRQGVATLEESL